MVKYSPRGQDYFKVIQNKTFYEIRYTKQTVVDGDIKADAFYSDFDKMEKAFNMLVKDENLDSVILWTVPKDMTFEELSLSTKFNKAQKHIWSGFGDSLEINKNGDDFATQVAKGKLL